VHDILERSDMTPLTPRTIVTVEGVFEKVREARENGYAFAAEEALLGELALAAAIQGPDGTPVGAVHIAGSLSEWTIEDFHRSFAPLAMGAAAALSG
jgi:IclR family transcriptional regulator, pca regulon regulatory protein